MSGLSYDTRHCLTYSQSGYSFIGNLDKALLRGITDNPSPTSSKIPEIVFSIYQLMFAAITPAIAIGSAAERVRIVPCILFIFVWSTLVYDVIACWCWSPNGWYYRLGGLDFAGGTPVHVASGAAALAFSLVLGRRNGHGRDEFKPHNITYVVLGTTFLWFGWFGFNGGSAEAASLRAAMACTVTNIAASFGGITWMIMDYRLERKLSTLGFCSGVVAGLVAITPGSGYVSPPSALIFGIAGGICCNLAVKLKHCLNYDDALDVFAVHGIGGLVGNILTGIFAQKSIALLDGQKINGGAIDGNPSQIAKQLSSSLAGMAYSFAMSYIILQIINKIPGCSLRLSADNEEFGTDENEIGESAYYFVERLVNNYQVSQPSTLLMQTAPVVRPTSPQNTDSIK
ncbi:7766_t:CDS:2 [Diversispora eburnea]|uniref:Ammonium transporter n=1 Tax=Diversispora eburnea TaxID=1213867 RepID=A0A9N8V072_9GLOM|nr:7766_t:CDS:2 [Diversispora eburnea]